jgi:hypothetical protein
MNLVIILVVSLFVQCNAYQLPTLRRFGPPASSIFAINHQTPSLPGSLTCLPVNIPSHSSLRLFSTVGGKGGGKGLALPPLDFSSNQTAFDYFNIAGFFGNKRRVASFVEYKMSRAGIPEEIKNNEYTSERALRIDLEKLGLDDLQIILNQDGFPIWQEMVGDEHIGVVRKITNRFNAWKNGRPIECDKKVNVYVNASFNRPPNEKRCPDFAIYGPDRLTEQDIRIVNGRDMNPHVIIQFSWANSIAKEKCAVDDMMNYAGVGEYIDLGRPNVAYLIKALRRGTSPELHVYGLDVFQVEKDQTTPEEPTMRYRCVVGVQEDTVISITPASMGLVDDGGGAFTIAMSDIREAIERRGVRFVPALGHEM